MSAPVRRVARALRGALGFLTRAPVGHDRAAWDAFRATPVAFPLAGYPIGVALALPLALPLSPSLAAFAFVCWVYVVTGIPHADAITDLGDAAVVHGTPAERREVMTDTTVGVGGALALGLVLLGLFALGSTLAALPLRALALVVTAEVGAKLAVAAVACLGDPAHEGLGSAVAGDLDARSLALPVAVSLPAALLAWPTPAGVLALVAALCTALCVRAWATRRLGGVSGDVLGGANELARLAALFAGVVAWTAW
nr:adenosylcobinamide-GDP ribazoletransferase [Halarchaeum rubridurum]